MIIRAFMVSSPASILGASEAHRLEAMLCQTVTAVSPPIVTLVSPDQVMPSWNGGVRSALAQRVSEVFALDGNDFLENMLKHFRR